MIVMENASTAAAPPASENESPVPAPSATSPVGVRLDNETLYTREEIGVVLGDRMTVAVFLDRLREVGYEPVVRKLHLGRHINAALEELMHRRLDEGIEAKRRRDGQTGVTTTTTTVGRRRSSTSTSDRPDLITDDDQVAV